jgi:hypothetical protein
MAAPTIKEIHPQGAGHVTVLEEWEITDGVGFTTPAVKAFSPPTWATDMVVYLHNTLVAGTTDTVDFKMEVVDPVNFDVATGTTPLGDWDGITQVTSTTNQLITIEVGPDVTADDTGSATASCRYGVRAVLPKWVLYTLTFNVGDLDEDYTGHLAVEFKRRHS